MIRASSAVNSGTPILLRIQTPIGPSSKGTVPKGNPAAGGVPSQGPDSVHKIRVMPLTITKIASPTPTPSISISSTPTQGITQGAAASPLLLNGGGVVQLKEASNVGYGMAKEVAKAGYGVVKSIAKVGGGVLKELSHAGHIVIKEVAKAGHGVVKEVAEAGHIVLQDLVKAGYVVVKDASETGYVLTKEGLKAGGEVTLDAFKGLTHGAKIVSTSAAKGVVLGATKVYETITKAPELPSSTQKEASFEEGPFSPIRHVTPHHKIRGEGRMENSNWSLRSFNERLLEESPILQRKDMREKDEGSPLKTEPSFSEQSTLATSQEESSLILSGEQMDATSSEVTSNVTQGDLSQPSVQENSQAIGGEANSVPDSVGSAETSLGTSVGTSVETSPSGTSGSEGSVSSGVETSGVSGSESTGSTESSNLGGGSGESSSASESNTTENSNAGQTDAASQTL